jgi:hypothetical protein
VLERVNKLPSPSRFPDYYRTSLERPLPELQYSISKSWGATADVAQNDYTLQLFRTLQCITLHVDDIFTDAGEERVSNLRQRSGAKSSRRRPLLHRRRQNSN